MSEDLVAFLRARYDEDEQAARAADTDLSNLIGWVEVEYPDTKADKDHALRHTPARVLADVDAKRRIVARVEHHASLMGRDEIHDDLLRLLALPYDDHRDYRDEWRP